MSEIPSPEVFFHVGLGKVASTYLQCKVFPKLENIHYIPTGKYRKSKQIIRAGKHDRYLVSREFDRQLERECQWFAMDFPKAKPVILLRRHDSWIASQYRRFVKNGFPGEFTEFMDIEEDRGAWKKKELVFYDKITVLENSFQHKPLVLFYDDFREDPAKFLSGMVSYMQATIDLDRISWSPKHTSYTEKQLKVMRKFSRTLSFIQNHERKSQLYKSIRRYLKMPLRYPILWIARLLPERWIPQGDLIAPEELEKIASLCHEDWQKCLAYARKNNPF